MQWGSGPMKLEAKVAKKSKVVLLATYVGGEVIMEHAGMSRSLEIPFVFRSTASLPAGMLRCDSQTEHVWHRILSSTARDLFTDLDRHELGEMLLAGVKLREIEVSKWFTSRRISPYLLHLCAFHLEVEWNQLPFSRFLRVPYWLTAYAVPTGMNPGLVVALLNRPGVIELA